MPVEIKKTVITERTSMYNPGQTVEHPSHTISDIDMLKDKVRRRDGGVKELTVKPIEGVQTVIVRETAADDELGPDGEIVFQEYIKETPMVEGVSLSVTLKEGIKTRYYDISVVDSTK